MTVPHPPRSVLLTGATGSLGGHVCAALLRDGTTTVHCLVRAPDTASAQDRLDRRLASLEEPPPHTAHRLVAVPGDLAAPGLGMSPGAYDSLAQSVDAVVHCAAEVNLAADHHDLAPANLDAVAHLVCLARRRTALTGHPPVVHHISTLAVFLAAREAGMEEADENTPVSHTTCGPHGYPRSKADAEILLRRAEAVHGLPVVIHRPGVITGHSVSGRTPPTDPLTPLLRAVVALGAAPGGDLYVPGERVDIVARCIATLLHHPAETGRAYHLVSPAPLRLCELTAALRRAGHRLSEMPPDRWWGRLEEHVGNPDVRPMAALRYISRPVLPSRPAQRMPRLRTDATWAALAVRDVKPTPWTEDFFDGLVSHLALPVRRATPAVDGRPRHVRKPQPGPPPGPCVPGRTPPVRVSGLAAPVTFAHDGHAPDFEGAAVACEAAGYGGFWAAEQRHDPLLALTRAAPHTTLPLGTAAVVALARSPMTLAHAAHDLQTYSGGRLTLGIGSQVGANLTHRYSVPGGHRVARLREFLQALRAIWHSWNTSAPMDFRGQYYTHVLTSPFFTPPPSPHGPPRVLLAATGPRTAELAGELADGLIAPPYAPPLLFSDVLLPALDRGLDRSGRTRQDVTVICPPLVATGRTCEERANEHTRVRLLLTLFCGTRAYRPVFELYQRGGLADEVSRLLLTEDPDRRRRAADLIDDETLGIFAAVPDTHVRTGELLRARYGGLADELLLAAPHGPGAEQWNPAALGLGVTDPAVG
ncbi:TIGR03617 family F420-dependent LLM class oxidoreductase [Streptomyces ziwulingensis]